MATTVAGEELMYFTTAAKPPLKGLFSPLPNLSLIHISDIDPNAFVSQSQVIGVYGEGFGKIKVK